MKVFPLFLLCYFACIGCTNPERDRAALLERELAETPILAPQFDSLMYQVRQLPATYQVGIVLNIASREERHELVAKQEALVLEALPLASHKEKKLLLLQLVRYYTRLRAYSSLKYPNKKNLQRIKELEEQHSLSQEERWEAKREQAMPLIHRTKYKDSLSILFELLTEHRAANEPILAIEDLTAIAAILSSLGDPEKAASLHQEAYQLAVDYNLPKEQKECIKNRILSLFYLERYTEVIHQLQKTPIDSSATAQYQFYSTLATCHLQLNRPDSARFYIEKMVQGSASDRDYTFHCRIAETYLAENREDSATAAITKMINSFREEEKRSTDTGTEPSFPFGFLPIYSTYATLLHRNGKDREALEAFLLIEPLMKLPSYEISEFALQIDGLTRFSDLCRATHRYEKTATLLARRDSLRDIYASEMSRRDSKRITNRFKTQELIYTIEQQKKLLTYSNRILVIVGAATLVLTSSIVMLTMLYRQRRRQLLDIQNKDQEIKHLRTHMNSISPSTTPTLSPQEELFRIAEQKVATERIFLNKELSLELLAQILDTNRSYLSATINSHANSNFNQWINGYRIRYILERINTTIDLIQLSDEAGFASVNSFYRNFKLYTGMTTGQYLKEKEEEKEKK